MMVGIGGTQRRVKIGVEMNMNDEESRGRIWDEIFFVDYCMIDGEVWVFSIEESEVCVEILQFLCHLKNFFFLLLNKMTILIV